ncbi:MAG: D-aminoacyl-tRNA deacylase [Candidatus Caldarchaeum sp.]
MKPVVMLSLQDIAAVNILHKLVENFGWRQTDMENVYVNRDVKIFCVQGSMLTADDQVSQVEGDLIVVPSKHVSESGQPCLLVHSTGNWGNSALFGGRPEMLSMTSAAAVYQAFTAGLHAAQSVGLRGLEVGMEATHHGPFSEKPLIFVEIGCSEKEWRNDQMAEAVAQTVADVCFQKVKKPSRHAVGFGGGHYARDIVKALQDGEFGVGHVASKHHFPMTSRMISQAFERTIEKPRTALIDWDGLKSEHRTQLLKQIEELNVEVIKV